jgi:hypothetical protein
MKNADMPAMPQSFAMTEQECGTTVSHMANDELPMNIGLTKREMFAMHALSSVLDMYNPYEQGNFDSSDYDQAAKHAAGLADALLKELEK